MSIIIKNASHGPKVVTGGLVLCLDAGNSKSYPGSGTTWTDLSGNGNNGTLLNGVGYNGSNLGSLSFDGIDDFVNVPSGIPTRTDTFTNEIWVYPTSLTGGQNGYSTLIRMIGTRPDNSSGDFYFQLRDLGQVHCGIRNTEDTGYDDYTSDNGVVSINNWFHIVQVIDRPSGNLKFYVNNSLILNESTSTYSIITSSPIQIAQQDTDVNGTFARRLTGRVSNVKLYNKALTATEVSQNFNALKSRFGL